MIPSRIILLIFILLILLILIYYVTLINKKEEFNGLNNVNIEDYDTKLLGPKCLHQCIQQYGPNIRFNNCEGKKADEILHWNKENPTKGYCYRANDDKFPFLCTEKDGDGCVDKCGNMGDDYGNNPDTDFSQCEISKDMGCIEKNLNMLSGGGVCISTGCYNCIDKYWDAINALNKSVKEIITEEKCRQDTKTRHTSTSD